MHFATSNPDKVQEFQQFIPDVQQLDIDLQEIQHVDHDAVVKDKARRAAHHTTPVFVEDTALHFDCLNGLPGPFVKWFIDKLSLDGMHELCQAHDNKEATAVTKIAYHDGTDTHVFTGSIHGTIVAPRGEGFGWDAIFQPHNYDTTFAEMNEEKHEISHRRHAIDAFTDWLDHG